jgi:hypothetical protein
VTLDERIDALTQSVELLALMHKDTEARFDQLALAVANTQARFDQLASAAVKTEAAAVNTGARFDQLALAAAMNEQRTGQLMDTMNRVGRILEAYDARMDEHEHRIDRLERPGA